MGSERPPTVTCRKCGAISPLSELFQPGSAGRRLSGLWCPFCRAYHWQYHGSRLLALAVVILGYAAWKPALRTEDDAVIAVALFAVAWLPVRVLTVFLHEAAHLLVARALGYRTWGMQIGSGDPIRRVRVGWLRIDFARDWTKGGGHAKVAPPPGTCSLRAERAVLLAPYPLHLALAAVAWPATGAADNVALWWFAVYQLRICVWGLWPRLRVGGVAATDGMLVERIARSPAWVQHGLRTLAARFVVQLARGEGTEEDAERALEELRPECPDPADREALRLLCRWPYSQPEPSREVLAAFDRFGEQAPEMEAADRLALGDPAGDGGAAFQHAAWLYYAGESERVIELLTTRMSSGRQPVERLFWQSLLATTALIEEPAAGDDRACALAEEASAALPWYDLAQIAMALRELARDDPDSALQRIHRARQYARPSSPTGIREGVRALALARAGQNDAARAAWIAASEQHPGPVLTRRVERELGLLQPESEPRSGDC